MSTPVIIDIVVVVFLVAFIIYGAKRGLLRTLAGVVIVVLALVGAGMLATTFASPVAKIVTPLVREQIAQRVEDAIAEWDPAQEHDLDAQALEEILKQLGVEEDTLQGIRNTVQEMEASAGATISDAVMNAAVEGLVRSIVYGILYVLAFVLLMLILHILAGAAGLLTKLPGVHTLNMLGGAVLGLAEGALLLFLAVWIGRKLGINFEAELLSEAHILRIFTTYTPLSILSFLQ